MPRKVPAEPQPINNGFIATLTQLRDGEHVQDASEALARLVKAVRETVKQGEITVKVKLVPLDDEALTVKTLVTVSEKLPKPDRKASVLFTSEDGRLSRDNPDQLKMKLVVVDAQTGKDFQPERQAANG